MACMDDVRAINRIEALCVLILGTAACSIQIEGILGLLIKAGSFVVIVLEIIVLTRDIRNKR